MARIGAGKKKKGPAHKEVQADPEESVDGEEYEVEEVIGHKRGKKTGLQYEVSWIGYPGEITWVPEADIAADELINAYWKKVTPSRLHERYEPGSKEQLAAKNKSDAADRTKSPSKKRSSTAAQVDEDVKSNSRRKSAPTAASPERQASSSGASRSSKKTPRDKSPVADSPNKKHKRKSTSTSNKPESEVEYDEETAIQRAGKSAPSRANGKANAAAQSPEPEQEDVQLDDGEAEGLDGYDADRPESNNDVKYADLESWEEKVSHIDTVERFKRDGDDPNDDTAGQLKLLVVWEDDTQTWVMNEVVRKKCPQQVINFYESHLKFKVNSQVD